MYDSKGSINFELPMPATETSEVLLARSGPVQVIAVPEVAVDSGAQSSPVAEVSQGSRDATTAPRQDRHAKWVKIPAAPATPKETPLWHYTDAAGATAIVRDGKLWASSVVALNDSTEYEHGRALASDLLAQVYKSRNVHPAQKKHIRRVVDMSEQVVADSGLFVLCASRAAHSLAQWRAYGGQAGHAVIIGADAPLAIVAESPMTFSTTDIYHQWRDVLYEASAKIDLIKRVLGYLAFGAPVTGSATDEQLRSAASSYVAALGHCKDESFREEQESRYLVQATSLSDLKFRATGNGIVPYLEVTEASGVGQRARPAADNLSLPIRGFVVGPFAARQESARGASSLLRANGYGHLNVEVSTSTLR
jgi:hypothetical protein